MGSKAEIILAGCRFLAYLAVLAACGSVLASRLGAAAGAPRQLASTARIVLVAAVVGLLLARPVQLVAQAAWMFADEGALSPGQLLLVATATSWGAGWIAQTLAAAALAVAVLCRHRGAIVAATVAVVACQPLTGHAVEDGFHLLPWLLQFAHVAAAGAWMGTLAVLAVHTARIRADEAMRNEAAGAWRSFSALARGGVAVLVVTGAGSALLLMDEPLRPLGSAYGRLLLAKVSAVAAVGAIGLRNWRRVLPRLPAAAATRSLLAGCWVELTLAAAVLLLTAVLVATSPS